jgi:hypothetical protein
MISYTESGTVIDSVGAEMDVINPFVFVQAYNNETPGSRAQFYQDSAAVIDSAIGGTHTRTHVPRWISVCALADQSGALVGGTGYVKCTLVSILLLTHIPDEAELEQYSDYACTNALQVWDVDKISHYWTISNYQAGLKRIIPVIGDSIMNFNGTITAKYCEEC